MVDEAGGGKRTFPKQTVNSCVQSLCREGYLVLIFMLVTGKRKVIHLTERGRDLVNRTTRLLAQVEETKEIIPTIISQLIVMIYNRID